MHGPDSMQHNKDTHTSAHMQHEETQMKRRGKNKSEEKGIRTFDDNREKGRKRKKDEGKKTNQLRQNRKKNKEKEEKKSKTKARTKRKTKEEEDKE